MHPGHHDPPPDPELPDAQLDFFHKLGYSTAQVQAVQQTFGATSDTDKMLGQLVRIGAGREAKQGSPASAPVTTMSVLVPRGDHQVPAPAVLLPLTGQSEESGEEEDALRPIVIDGSNVAMSHGNKEVFSCLGIQLSVNYFLDRGHTDVTVFVPSWRKEQPRPDVPITDQHILRDLERRKILVFTPSRRVAGKRVVCNDDCFIVKHGFESDGVVVSNDMYRDLQGEKPEWKRFIEERLLMYSFVNNKFMPPDDPLGRHGPSLENFLKKFPKTQKKQLCPYGKKCTYGIKCKFLHPERAKQSNRLLADELRESAKQPAPPSHAGAGFSLLLVEHMAKKLTLNQESGPAKKSEPAKSGHRSGRKSSSRRDKAGQNASLDREPAPASHRGSQDQLDSGLGSIDSQPLEAPWSLCEPAYAPSYGSCHGARQQYCRPQGAPCGSCSHSPPPLGPPGYHAGGAAPTCSQGPVTPYGPPPHYPAYRGFPVSMGAYSQPADFQHGRVPAPHHHHHHQAPPYWSDPFPHHPVRSLPAERPHWEAGSPPGTGRKEREVVRKKLLAIFSAQLVDTAMDMFPQVMDPQVLVAEILALQSGNHSLR